MSSISQYSVGAIKTFRGHDGYGYSCNLLRNGKKVAEVLEDGWGGGLQFSWLDYKNSTVVNSRTYEGNPHIFNGTVEESLFYDEVMKLPKIKGFSDNDPDMFTDPDIVVDEMVNDALDTKKIKADLKKKFMIQFKDGKISYWKITPEHTLEVLRNHIKKDYPDALIINDLTLNEAVTFYKANNL